MERFQDFSGWAGEYKHCHGRVQNALISMSDVV